MRCDESMRRSKERGYLSKDVRWKCTKDCEHCVCALFKKPNGTWEHRSFNLAHTKKEEVNV